MKVTDEMVASAVAAFAAGDGFEATEWDAVAWSAKMRDAITAALSHDAGQEAVAEVSRDGSIIWLALRPLKAGIKLYTHPRTCPSGEVEDET